MGTHPIPSSRTNKQKHGSLPSTLKTVVLNRRGFKSMASLAHVTGCLSCDGVAQSRRRGEQTWRARATAADQGRSPAGRHRAAAAGPVVRRHSLQHVVLVLLQIALALGDVGKQTRRRQVDAVVRGRRKMGGMEWRDERGGRGGFLAVMTWRCVMTSTMTYDDDNDGERYDGCDCAAWRRDNADDNQRQSMIRRHCLWRRLANVACTNNSISNEQSQYSDRSKNESTRLLETVTQ